MDKRYKRSNLSRSPSHSLKKRRIDDNRSRSSRIKWTRSDNDKDKTSHRYVYNEQMREETKKFKDKDIFSVCHSRVKYDEIRTETKKNDIENNTFSEEGNEIDNEVQTKPILGIRRHFKLLPDNIYKGSSEEESSFMFQEKPYSFKLLSTSESKAEPVPVIFRKFQEQLGILDSSRTNEKQIESQKFDEFSTKSWLSHTKEPVLSQETSMIDKQLKIWQLEIEELEKAEQLKAENSKTNIVHQSVSYDSNPKKQRYFSYKMIKPKILYDIPWPKLDLLKLELNDLKLPKLDSKNCHQEPIHDKVPPLPIRIEVREFYKDQVTDPRRRFHGKGVRIVKRTTSISSQPNGTQTIPPHQASIGILLRRSPIGIPPPSPPRVSFIGVPPRGRTIGVVPSRESSIELHPISTAQKVLPWHLNLDIAGPSRNC